MHMSAVSKPLPCSPRRLAVLIGSIALLGGCAVTPKPLTTLEAQDRVREDQTRLYVAQEQIFAPIGFEEAVARALKYNLDYRLKLMESALSGGLFELSTYDMLPNLVASAGYQSRNNDSGGRSLDLDTGTIGPSDTTSQERRRTTSAIEFSWNALDFGMSYYRARQQADEYLIAEERRQRVIQNILQDVRASYWRAVGAQRLAHQAEALSERAQTALTLSRTAEAQGLLPPREALTYQRQLLDAVALLATRRQELEYARRELAALLNITPGTEFSVVEDELPPLMPAPFNVTELEEVALLNRPELREEDYRKRITADEARRQITALLPGISFNVGAQYDSNKYLYNNNWVDAGVRLSFSLLKPLSLPAMERVHEAQRHNDEARRLALTMAVITQVRLAVERYRLSLHDLEIARESSLVDQRLAAYARAANSARAGNELELIRAETRALNSEYQRYAVYAAAQAAFGRIYNALGLSVLPADTTAGSVSELANTLSEHLRVMEGDVFPQTVDAIDRDSAVELDIEAPAGAPAIDLEGVRRGVSEALQRNRIRVAPNAQAAKRRLKLSLELGEASNGVRRAHWHLSMTDAGGQPLGATRYSSALPSNAGSQAYQAFAESAAMANLRNIETWSAAATPSGAAAAAPSASAP